MLAKFISRLTPADRSAPRPWRLSVRSKFLMMMLATSLLSLGTITYLAYHSGKATITDAAVNQLTSIRAAKKQQVEYYFRAMRASFRALADGPVVVEALEQMAAGYRQLGDQALAPARLKALEAYYARTFVPALARSSDQPVRLEDYLPSRPAAQAVQTYYIAENASPVGEKSHMVRHAEDNAYNRAHEVHHPWLSAIAYRLTLDDLFLIDADGNIVYTVVKEPDLGQSVVNGPVAGTKLGQLVRELMQSRRPGETRFADYSFYRPSLNRPAGFIAAPLFKGERFVGVVAAQISVDEVSNFMNDGGKWREQGLGKSGSVYVVGPDMLMRSNYRPMLENSPALIEQMVRRKLVTPAVGERMRQHKTTVLYYPHHNAPFEKGLRGHSATELFVNQRGVGAYLSYAPLDIPDLKWVIVARMDQQEVLASQIAFNRNVMIAACTIALLVTLAALWLAGMFLRPITALLDGIERLRRGERGVAVANRTNDEFSELVTAFNGMAETIRVRDEVIEGKSRAYEQLLKNIFPDVVADRMKQGEVAIVESFAQVTVVYAIVDGFVEVAERSDAQRAIKILTEVVDRLDGIAEAKGVEKVKTVGDHYLAVSGLSVARLDSALRALEFAKLAWQELQVVNREHGLELGLRMGIATGPVQVGLVGSRRFVFDVWGYAASVARRIVYDADLESVRLNAEALAQLTDRAGVGEELVVRMKSLGPITTFQIRLGVTPGVMAAQ